MIKINGKECKTPEEIQEQIAGNYNKQITGGITEIKGVQININLKKTNKD